jgi:hypothetical protein
MDPRKFVEIRTRRYVAQALDEFERRVETPLVRAASVEPCRADLAAIVADVERVKRTVKKRFYFLGDDCVDLMPESLEINAVELVRRNA